MLVGAAEGAGSTAWASDLERCLQLGGTDLNDDKLFAALNTLTIYYINRGELRRAEPIVALVEPRRPSIPMGGAWGVMALFGGQLDVARPLIEQWKFDLALASQEFEDSWIVPFDYRAAACVGLGALRLLQGDLAGADAEFAEAADRSERAAFPKGPNTLAYVRFGQIWMCTESAQLDRAATLAADLLAVTERHGLDGWHLVGVVQHAAVSASISLDSGCDPADVAAQLETASRRLDTWQDAGYGAFRPMYDRVLARLLIAAGHHEEARRRIDTGLRLADATGVHYYDAELLRLRAKLQADPDTKAADLAAAIDLTRRQEAFLFELRSALDDFKLRGEPARCGLADAVKRMPADSAWPELTRARAALGLAESAQ
ncbi:MAG TPA: hypothetical protein VF874_04405 [Mycobacterium sp.]